MTKEVKKGPSLFEIVEQSKKIEEEIISREGDITGDLERELVRNKEELEIKSVSYCWIIDNNKAQIEQLKQMEKQIRERRRALENTNSRLSGALLAALEVSGIKKIESSAYRITVGKKRSYIEVEQEDRIPEDYFNREEVVKLDRTRLLEDLKNGAEIPGVNLIDDDTQLYIK